jgi:hypothetical protein
MEFVRDDRGRDRFLAIALTAIAVLLAACGGTHRSRSFALEQQRLARTSPYQKQVLSGGVIKYADYERAVLATLDCIKRGNFPSTVLGPRLGSDGLLDYQVGLTLPAPDPALETRFEQYQLDCVKQYSEDVSAVYSEQLVPSDKERKVLLASVARCLQTAGLKVPKQPSLRQISEALGNNPSPAAKACIDENGRAFIAPQQR